MGHMSSLSAGRQMTPHSRAMPVDSAELRRLFSGNQIIRESRIYDGFRRPKTIIFPTLAAIFIVHSQAQVTQQLLAQESQPSRRRAVSA
jgi:hypothetical protein